MFLCPSNTPTFSLLAPPICFMTSLQFHGTCWLKQLPLLTAYSPIKSCHCFSFAFLIRSTFLLCPFELLPFSQPCSFNKSHPLWTLLQCPFMFHCHLCACPMFPQYLLSSFMLLSPLNLSLKSTLLMKLTWVKPRSAEKSCHIYLHFKTKQGVSTYNIILPLPLFHFVHLLRQRDGS